MDDVNVGHQEMHSEYDQVLLGKIRQYQNSIIKHSESGNDAKILSYIRKLYDMPVTVAHLQETGIGRTINSLRKYSGDVGTASKAIVYKWKDMVAREEQQTTETTEPPEATVAESESRRSPTPEPPEETKHKKSEHKHSSEDRHSKHRSSSSTDRNIKKSESTSDRNNKNNRKTVEVAEPEPPVREEHVSRNKSHHTRKDEKRDSHKSSHSKEKEHRKSSSSESPRKEDKYRPEKKRKHEDEQSPTKKKKYDIINDSDSDESTRLLIQENSIDSLSQSDENILLPDSTTVHHQHHHPPPPPPPQPQPQPQEIYRERTQSPCEEIIPSTSNSNHKKHHKSDKHRNNDKDSSDNKKHLNGSHSSSSKKSSHRDKHSSDSSKKEKLNSSSGSGKSADTKDSSKKPKPEKVKKILIADNGIDSGSGASFAEALGMMEPVKSSKNVFNKKKTSSSPTPTASAAAAAAASASTSKSKTSKPAIQSPLLTQSPPANLLSSNIKLEPLDINISQLPEITTNYKPLTQYSTYDSSPAAANHLKQMTDEEALSVVISSKTQRTKVFSGNKTNWGFVPTLFQLCVRVLQDNIDALEYTGGVPYEILRPVLERATANQLLNTEYHNPYLVEDSDELWAKHCKRECRGIQRQEMESWRDMYLRCRDERDAKLKALTVNIKQSIDKSLPVRQTKLAYVDNYVKPPRSIARKQAKYGTDCKSKPLITPTSRLNAIASSSNEPRVSVPNPGTRAITSSSGGAIKPKKAPLMQKTLALMKGRFGRR